MSKAPEKRPTGERDSNSEEEERRIRKSDKNLDIDDDEEEEEEEEEEEDENRYEIDGFVVADDDIEEVEEPALVPSPKPKKSKKSRKRLKKRVEDSDSEDRELIEENINRSAAADTYKQPRYSDSSDEEGIPRQNDPVYPEDSMHYRTEYSTIAAIFAYENHPQSVPNENQPEFEPAEKKERFRTQEYEAIREIDIPERLQKRLKSRENPTQEELSAEAEWIFSRYLSEKKNIIPTESLRIKITKFLCLYRVDKYEIPFIHMYRMHMLIPDIGHDQLWEFEKWDMDWGFVYENKSKFKVQIEIAAENAVRISNGEEFSEMQPVLRSYDGPGYIPLQIWELINNTYTPEFVSEIQDLQKYVDAFIYSYPIKKTSNPILLAYTNRIPEFLQKSGINPLQLSENLKKRELIHQAGISHISSEDAAFDLLCDLYKDETKVKSIAQLIAKKEISSLPWTRKFVREEYKKYAKLHTTPTDIGKGALDIYHPLYRVKRLVGKPLDSISPELWADIWKAEQSGWIISEFKFSWTSINDDKILGLLQPLYLSAAESEIDESWNHFRLEILQQALEEMYSDFSKELYSDFCSKAEDLIIHRCKNSYIQLLAKPPLSMADDGGKSKIMVVVTDPLVEFFGQSVLVVMDCNGIVAGIGYFRTLAARSFETLSKTDQTIYRKEKKEIEELIVSHHPHSIIVAANCLHSINIRKYMETISSNLNIHRFQEKLVDWKIEQNQLLSHKVKILMHDTEVSKLFASSQRAKGLLPDGDILLKNAVSLGRYIQMPLAEALGLWSDPNELLTMFLPLDPMQKLVNQKRLEWQLENVACEEVSKVGVDINRIVNYTHMQSLLRFIPGLGPAKAYYLLEAIYKKFKGRLKMRAAIISKRLLGVKVYENAAGFIYIRYEERETEPLDSTRIHPEHYEMAQKIAKSALELPDDHKEDETIAKIMRDPHSIRQLDLPVYANQLEKSTGQENMIKVLEFIVHELEHPFQVEKKQFQELTGLELLYLTSGESPITLSRGKLVHCTVLSYDDRSQSLVVKLESGLKGSIEKLNVCEGREPTKDDMKSFVKGLSLVARVLEVSAKTMETDIFFRIKLSILLKDLADHKSFLDTKILDSYFEKNEEDWNDKSGLEDDKYRQGQKYVPRVVNHPKFKNVGLKTACEELESRDIGECIFRPSSRGQDHITCTWKFYTAVYVHLDIKEEGKPATNMLGTKFKIGEEVYESLQEIIDRYITPCEKLTKEAVSSPKFRDFQTNIISLLKAEKKQKPNTIPYYFTILEQYPQFLVLYYLPKEKTISEFIKVKPRGLFFHEAYHTSLNYLISWFKRHHSERPYQSQLSRTKAPTIDTTNYYSIKGRVERPMTPLHSQGTPRREEPSEELSYGNRTPEHHRDDDRRDRRVRRRSRGERMDRGERRDDRKCTKCGGEGHFSKDCMRKGVSTCYNCGKEGHFAKECSERKRRPDRDDEQWRTPIDTPEPNLD